MAKVKTEFNTQIEIQEVKTAGEDEIFQQELFNYLEELRVSGETNMYAAAPYIEKIFGIENKEANEYLHSWLDSFNI